MSNIERPLWSKFLGVASLVMIVLETVRATNAIAHATELGGLSVAGLLLPADLIAAGGPMAATLVLLGIGLSWKQQRAGYVIVLFFACLFFITHVLDQLRVPGPPVSELARISGLLPAWAVMVWAWSSVVVASIAIYALSRRAR
jgi:hypothetical protein